MVGLSPYEYFRIHEEQMEPELHKQFLKLFKQVRDLEFEIAILSVDIMQLKHDLETLEGPQA